MLVLTARDTWSDKVKGLRAGADDYLAKPFHMEELIARVEALIRRDKGSVRSLLTCGEVQLDAATGRVTRRGEAVVLTALEHRLLAYLMHRPGAIVSKAELTEHIYDQDFDKDSNVIEVLVNRLRKKFGADFIKTRRGLGYMIGDDAAAPDAAGRPRSGRRRALADRAPDAGRGARGAAGALIAGASLLWLFYERIESKFDAFLTAYQQQLIARRGAGRGWRPAAERAAGRSAFRPAVLRLVLAGERGRTHPRAIAVGRPACRAPTACRSRTSRARKIGSAQAMSSCARSRARCGCRGRMS